MWCVIPVWRSLQQSPIISANDLIFQSEQALFIPPPDSQKARLLGERVLFTTSPQEIINQSLLPLKCYWAEVEEVHSTVIQSFSFQVNSAGTMEKKNDFESIQTFPLDKSVLTWNIQIGN